MNTVKPRIYLLLILFATAIGIVLAGCGSSGGSSSSSKSSYNYSFTVTDATYGNMVAGKYAVMLLANATNNGSICTGVSGNAMHMGAGLISAGPTVTIPFTTNTGVFPGWVLASVYVDLDQTQTLSNNDKVWGTGGASSLIGYICFSSLAQLAGPSNDSFDWTAVADFNFGANNGSNDGWSLWGGGTQTVSVGAGGVQPLDLPSDRGQPAMQGFDRWVPRQFN